MDSDAPARAHVVLDDADIGRAVRRIAHEIVEKARGADSLVLLGIPTRGVALAERIARAVADIEGTDVPVGALDITLYRDDLRLRPARALEETTIPPAGIDERTVVLRHVLKNALLPVITIVGLQLPLMIGGAVVIEQIFVISGMGQLLLMAVSQRDYPVITGIFLLVGVGVMTINLLVDISYALLDPKIRQG